LVSIGRTCCVFAVEEVCVVLHAVLGKAHGGKWKESRFEGREPDRSGRLADK
jgi:hypothetical protein